MPMPVPTQFPLIMTFSELMQIGDAIVRVSGDTSVLGEVSPDGSWRCATVSAGGVEEGGATLVEAYRAVRNQIRLVLEDCAYGVDAVDAFENEVANVFSSVNPETKAAWDEALRCVRAGQCSPTSGAEKLPVKRAAEIRPVSVGLVSEPGMVENLEQAA